MEQKKISDPDGEHIFHMWEPLTFEVKEGYDYIRNTPVKRLAHDTLRTFAHLVLGFLNRFLFGLRIRGRRNLKALQHNGPAGAVTICNHIHPMDCTMIDLALGRRRMYYLTLESNFRIPLVRHIIRTLGGVPLSARPGCTKELFAAMGTQIEKGACVQIYPESVLHPYYEGIRPFKKGAFYLAVRNQTPILPMVITYRRPSGIYRLYKHKPCLTLNILPPVFPNPAAGKPGEVLRLMKECERLMREAYDALSV